MVAVPRELRYESVFYQHNIDFGLDPYCHECISHCGDKNGYPKVRRNHGHWRAHRWVWYQATGDTPEVVMHLCDNPKCLNLAHLQAGTYADNNHDRDQKNRWRGGRPGALSFEQVEELRLAYAHGESRKSLVARFGVSLNVIQQLVSGKTCREGAGPITCRGVRSLLPHEVIKIREACLTGESLQQLATRFGVSKSTVARVVTGEVYKELGGPIRRSATAVVLSAEDVRCIRRLKNEGVPQIYIAKKFGVSSTTISRILHRLRYKAIL